MKLVCLLTCLGLASSRGAEPAVSTSLSLRGFYDDNVFLQDDAPLAAGQFAAALPAQGRAFVTEVGASLGLAWKKNPSFQFDASYAPEIFRYSRYQTENHTDHRLKVKAAGSEGAWRYEVKAGWLSTVGTTDAPVFNRLGGSPPVGSEPVRARRSQDISKASAWLTRTHRHGFARGVFAWSAQDFHTRELTTFGCANYVDRGEWSAGADLGWELQPNFCLIAAARDGRQHQANLLGVPLNYTNRFHRWLLGAEGQLSRSCKISVLAGWDARAFGPAVRANFARHQTTSYWEANATWTPTKADTLTLNGKRYLWVSSGGRGVYVDTLYDLAWQHQLAQRWSLSTGLNQHLASTGRYNPASPRQDAVYAVAGSVTRTLDAKTRLDFGVTQDWSRSSVPNTPGREYHRRIYTIGCARVW